MNQQELLISNEAEALSQTAYFLSFENFLKCKNNFHLHFVNNWEGNMYRQ